MNYKKIFLIIFIILSIIILFYYVENKLLFFPTKLAPNHCFNLDIYEDRLKHRNVTVNEKMIRTKDNIRINLIHFNNPNNKNLFIYAHGNGGNITNSLDFCYYLVLYNLGSVITFDYRGYGKSDGTPSEQGVYNDVLAVWNYTTNKLGYNPNNITLYGHSLGSSVVAWLGHMLCKQKKQQKEKPNLIIMQAGFSSLKKIAAELYPKFLSYIMRNNFNSEHYVKTIGSSINILVLHSYNDEMIKIHHKDNLIKANGTDKIKFHEIKGDHNSPNIDDKVMDAIRKLCL